MKWLAKQFLKPFIIKRPDIIKERMPRLIRGKTTSKDFNLTFGNVLDQYRKYLKADRHCPPALKSSFERLGKDY